MEGWGVVHLQEPRLQVPVQDDIEPENFKTAVSGVMMRKARSVHVRELRLRGDNSFAYEGVDPIPDLCTHSLVLDRAEGSS
eukprot:gene8431-biopygen14660